MGAQSGQSIFRTISDIAQGERPEKKGEKGAQ